MPSPGFERRSKYIMSKGRMAGLCGPANGLIASSYVATQNARKGIDASQRLGRHRWVIERTLAWLNRCRRLTIRYERRADIHQAFLTLGCALICFKALQNGF